MFIKNLVIHDTRTLRDLQNDIADGDMTVLKERFNDQELRSFDQVRVAVKEQQLICKLIVNEIQRLTPRQKFDLMIKTVFKRHLKKDLRVLKNTFHLRPGQDLQAQQPEWRQIVYRLKIRNDQFLVDDL